jgi:hypothetical protein
MKVHAEWMIVELLDDLEEDGRIPVEPERSSVLVLMTMIKRLQFRTVIITKTTASGI